MSSAVVRAGAYVGATRAQVTATLALLRHFKAFLASPCERMRDPTDSWGREIGKEEARRRLTRLVDVAINRRAGIPDLPPGKTAPIAYYRDTRAVNAHFQDRIILRHLETRQARRRFAQHFHEAD